MHTEVDVPNPEHVLLPGLYAEASVALEHRDNISAIPLVGLVWILVYYAWYLPMEKALQ